MRIVKTAFTHKFGNGATVDVPAGARCERPVPGEEGYVWLDPSIYPANSMARHDATHYGVRVSLDNTEEC